MSHPLAAVDTVNVKRTPTPVKTDTPAPRPEKLTRRGASDKRKFLAIHGVNITSRWADRLNGPSLTLCAWNIRVRQRLLQRLLLCNLA